MTFVRPGPATVPQPRAWGYGCSIDDGTNETYFPLVSPAAELLTAPQQAPRIRTEQSAEDFADDYGQTYSRSLLDGGHGLDFLHDPNRVNAESRFYKSDGIDVFVDDPASLASGRLLPAGQDLYTSLTNAWGVAEIVWPSAPTDVFVSVLTSGGLDRILKITDLHLPTPATSLEDPLLGHGTVSTSVPNIAALNGLLYVAMNTEGIHRRTDGAPPVYDHWSDFDTNRIWSVKERIIAGNDAGELRVAAAGAGSVLIKDLGFNHNWYDVADLGPVIGAVSTDGIYFFEDQAGSLVEVGFVPNVPGERFFSLHGSSRGVTFIASIVPGLAGVTPDRGRVYTATTVFANGVASLDDLQVIFEESDTVAFTKQRAPRFAETQDSVVWGFAYASEDEPGLAATGYRLWRYYFPTGGVARWLGVDRTPASGIVQPLATDGGVVVATQTAVWRQDPSGRTVASGWLIGPAADFFTARDKQWAEAIFDVGGDVSATAPCTLSYTTDPMALIDPDDPSWTAAVTRDSATPTRESSTLTAVTGRYLAGLVRLARDPAALTDNPEFRSYSFRAFPPADQDRILRLRVNVSDHVEAPNRKPVHADGFGSYMFGLLKSYEGQDVTVTLFEPSVTLVGQITSVATPVREVTERGSSTLVAEVEIRGRET